MYRVHFDLKYSVLLRFLWFNSDFGIFFKSLQFFGILWLIFKKLVFVKLTETFLFEISLWMEKLYSVYVKTAIKYNFCQRFLNYKIRLCPFVVVFRDLSSIMLEINDLIEWCNSSCNVVYYIPRLRSELLFLQLCYILRRLAPNI